MVDVGSGPGFDEEELEALLHEPPSRVVLLDPQRSMLLKGNSSARGGSPPLWARQRVVGDAARLPIKDSSVDVLLSLGVLCCIADVAVDDAVRESLRVLHPGGWVVLGVPRRRGAADEARFRTAGFQPGPRKRAGLAVFRKPL